MNRKQKKLDTKPNAFMVGFPRSGSTYLANILKQHPEISIPDNKEINYLNNTYISLIHPKYKSPDRIHSFDWYCSFFENKKIRMDCSIRAIYDPHTIERIKKKLGDIFILIVIRKDKNDFKKSLFKTMKIHGEIKKDMRYVDFETKFKKLLDYYSDFDKHIRYYKKNFKKVLVIDIISSNKEKETEKILKFLDIKDFKFDYNLPRNTQNELSPKNNKSYYLRKIFMGVPVLSFFLQKIVEIIKYRFKRKSVIENLGGPWKIK